MRRDILSAYLVSGTRIGSWAVVSAVVYRELGAGAFGLLALVRGTIGLLNYAAVGLGPALIRAMAEESSKGRWMLAGEEADGSRACGSSEAIRDPASGAYANGLIIAAVAGAVGLAITWAYAWWFGALHRVGSTGTGTANAVLVGAFGIGTVLRVVSDAPGAVLQSRGEIAKDNGILASGDILWAVLTWALLEKGGLNAAAFAFAWANAAVLVLRAGLVHSRWGVAIIGRFSLETVWRLLSAGGLIVLAQLADYLYAPTDYILIDRLLDPMSLAVYAPAVQIDGGLLVLVAAIGAVLLPKSAVAHSVGDLATVRRYYIRGTLASIVLLLPGAICVWVLSPWVFRVWLGNEMPGTQAILPLVFVHTVVGGSSAVGRSILLGMGKVRAFTIAVLMAGAVNVGLSVVFVKYLGWGLKGIVVGTIVAVVLRCGVWMPWYVLCALRQDGALGMASGAAVGTDRAEYR